MPRFLDVKFTAIHCTICGHRWKVDTYAHKTRTKTEWVMARGTIQCCPECKDKLHLKITSVSWE